MDIKKLKRLNVQKLADAFDEEGSELALRLLRHMDSQNIYYTSLMAKTLKYTWANTYNTIRKMTELGLIKSCMYVEKYNKKYGNITGLVLTKKGHTVRVRLLKHSRK